MRSSREQMKLSLPRPEKGMMSRAAEEVAAARAVAAVKGVGVAGARVEAARVEKDPVAVVEEVIRAVVEAAAGGLV
ncbi:MAG TPA: hypothetical protein VJ808_04675, partial [Gemmatimonadales bacterium]|nr:hypothetical protein [Gemmatimonadales bacterium]